MLVAIIVFSTINIVQSAGFRIVRTDVDSTLSDFITAKYMFSFDIYLDDIEYCNNVSFQLRYDNASIIDYDGHIQTEFSKEIEPYTLEKDSQTDFAFLNISVYTGESIKNSYFPNPKVLTLQFVVTPTAENGRQVTFEFITALATTLENDTPVSITVDVEPIVFDVHGFVDVLPGNADNDSEGLVNASDHVKIALHKGIEKEYPGARFFKRDNASTGKYLQKCLVWDIADATYADCNGDGTITISDAVVVSLNFDEDQLSEKEQSELQAQSDIYNKNIKSQTSVTLPILVESLRDYNTAFGNIVLAGGQNYKILGVQAGELFANVENLVIDDFDEKYTEQIQQREIEFFITGYGSKFSAANSGELIKIIIEPGEDFIKPEYVIEKINGISLDKNIFELNLLTTSLDGEKFSNDFVEIYYGSTSVTLNPLNISDLKDVSLYNALGNKIDVKVRLNRNKLVVGTSPLLSGTYILVHKNNNIRSSYKLIITK